MEQKIRWVTEKLLRITFVFMVINLISGCMNMKHGIKTDMTDHGAGVVWMKHDHFSRGLLLVANNSTVTWANKDWWPHTVTSDTGLFDSGKIKSGKTYTYKFTTAGTYHYHCEIHDSMMAKIIVH